VSDFTVVGVFDSAEAAQHAAREVRQMIEAIKSWWEKNPEEWEKYTWADETPTPPEVEIGQRFGFKWPGAIDWSDRASIKVVLDRFVYISTEGFRPTTAGEPFDKVLQGLGGEGLLHADFYGEQIGTILAEISCTAPNAAIAQEILEKYLSWDLYGKVESSRLHLYDWTFSEFDLPEVIEYLNDNGCTAIQYRLYQSQDPGGKTPTVSDLEVLIQVLESGKAWDIEQIADTFAKLGDIRAVEPLLRAMDTADGLDRLHIARALGDLRDARAVDALIALLDDDGVLSAVPIAVQSLAKIGDTLAVAPLIKLLQNDKYWQLSTGALAYFGQSAHDALTHKLEEIPSQRLHQRLSDALTLVDAVMNFGPSFQILRNIDWGVQQSVFEDVKRSPHAVDLLIAIMRCPPVHDMRIGAMNALAEISDPRAIAPIADFILYLGGQGLRALEKFGAPALEPLMGLVKHPETWVRDAAVWSLGRLADSHSTDTLLGVLQSPQWDVLTKRGAARGLAQIGDERAVQPIVNMYFENTHPDHDAIVIDCLRKLNAVSELATRIVTELEHDHESYMAIRNISVLGQIGDNGAIAPLLSLREQASTIVHKAIADALMRLGYVDGEISH